MRRDLRDGASHAQRWPDRSSDLQGKDHARSRTGPKRGAGYDLAPWTAGSPPAELSRRRNARVPCADRSAPPQPKAKAEKRIERIERIRTDRLESSLITSATDIA